MTKAKLLFALATLCISAGPGFAAANKVSLVEARRLALARVPGTVVHEKLKHEKQQKDSKKPKEHDHYNFKIRPRDHAKAGLVKKVEIDAETGQVLSVKDGKAK